MPRSSLRLAFAIFLIVLTVRLTLVLLSATEVPFYDAWETTIDQMALPLLEHRFDTGTLFVTHNEHVFLPTRLVDLIALAIGDTQYNGIVVCIINQILYAIVAAALIGAAVPLFAPRARLFVGTATLYVCLPYDFENVAQPLTNMYVFLLGFSSALIFVCVRARTYLSGIAGILSFGLLATLSTGGGFFAAVIGVGVVGVRRRCGDLDMRKTSVFAGALTMCVIVGLFFARRAVSVVPVIGAIQIMQCLLVAMLWAPTAMLARRILQTRSANDVELAAVALSAWGALQILAMIAARPEFRVWLPISRYMEILGVAAFANLGCLMRVALSNRTFGLPARAALPIFLLAIVVCTPYAASWFARRASQLNLQAERVLRYVHEHDVHAFDNAPADEFPFPSRDYLLRRLDTPSVQYVLGDRFGTRATPATATHVLRAVTEFLAATAWFWWLGVAAFAAWLSSDFFRSADRHAPRENELA